MQSVSPLAETPLPAPLCSSFNACTVDVQLGRRVDVGISSNCASRSISRSELAASEALGPRMEMLVEILSAAMGAKLKELLADVRGADLGLALEVSESLR